MVKQHILQAVRIQVSNMKKIYAVNGSCRNDFNTAQVLKSALEGAKSAGADTELINLGEYSFSGCRSCMACKSKNTIDKPLCAWQDPLTPVLEKLLDADGIIMGSPVYFGNASGVFRSFMERLYFPLLRYTNPPSSKLKVSKQAAMIWTMNVPENMMTDMNYYQELGRFTDFTQLLLKCDKVDTLYVCDTFQFKDYANFDADWFDVEHKKSMREKQFPQDQQKAFALGERMAKA